MTGLPSPRTTRLTFTLLLTALVMSSLDYRIANVILPNIADTYHASSATTLWVVVAYILGNATSMITAANLGDHFGQWRIFTLGIAVFTIASLGCGLAPNPTALITMRAAQGIGAALMTPQITLLTKRLYPRTFGHAQATIQTVGGAVAVSGFLIGGLLTSANIAGLGWRAAFLVNLPIGIAALIATRLLPDPPNHPNSIAHTAPQRHDYLGSLLIISGIGMMVLALIQGREQGWPLWSLVLLIASPLTLWLFATVQRHHTTHGRTPLLDTAVFRTPGFASGTLAMLLLRGSSTAAQIVLALYLQQHAHMGPSASGAMFIPLGIGTIIASTTYKRVPWSPARTARIGSAARVLGFAALVASGLAGSLPLIIIGLLTVGIGQSWAYTPLRTSLLDASPQHRSGATGVLETIEYVAGAFGIAGIGLVLFTGPIVTGFTLSMITLVGVSVIIEALLWFHRRATPHG